MIYTSWYVTELPLWCGLYHIRQSWYQIQNLLEKWLQMIYIHKVMWLNYHFDMIYTISGNSDIRLRISLKNAFKWYIYHPIWLNYLFWHHPYRTYYVILISDSESPWKMLSNDIYIILFGWITFFGLTHTVLCNTNIRFRISLKNAFKWYIYHSIWLNYLFWPHPHCIM